MAIVGSVLDSYPDRGDDGPGGAIPAVLLNRTRPFSFLLAGGMMGEVGVDVASPVEDVEPTDS